MATLKLKTRALIKAARVNKTLSGFSRKLMAEGTKDTRVRLGNKTGRRVHRILAKNTRKELRNLKLY